MEPLTVGKSGCYPLVIQKTENQPQMSRKSLIIRD
jgi:hypothetical protein